MLIVSRISPMSGIMHRLEMDITYEQYESWFSGMKLVQEAFPKLSADEREFILTGITAEEWDKTFKIPES